MAEWLDQLNGFMNQFFTNQGEAVRTMTQGTGLAPQIDEDIYSVLEGQMGLPSEDEINNMLNRLGGLSAEDRGRVNPLANLAFGGGPKGRRSFNALDQLVSQFEQVQQIKTRNEGIAGGLKDFTKNLSNDPFFTNIREAIGEGMNKDVIDEQLLQRLINQSTDKLLASGEEVTRGINENAAARGIYGSGKALEDSILAKVNLRGEATNAETNIRSGAAVENAKSKQNFATIGAGFEGGLANLQGSLDNAAAALLAGSPNPFADVQGALNNITGIGEAESQLKFLNQSSSADAMKQLLNLVSGGVQSGIENTMGLFSLLKKSPNSKSGGSSWDSFMNSTSQGFGQGLGTLFALG